MIPINSTLCFIWFSSLIKRYISQEMISWMEISLFFSFSVSPLSVSVWWNGVYSQVISITYLPHSVFSLVLEAVSHWYSVTLRHQSPGIFLPHWPQHRDYRHKLPCPAFFFFFLMWVSEEKILISCLLVFLHRSRTSYLTSIPYKIVPVSFSYARV